MDAFFCVVLSIIVLRMWWRSETRKIDPRELRRNTVKSRWDRIRIKNTRLKQEAANMRKLAREQRKRKVDEELITVIIPTIHSDGK